MIIQSLIERMIKQQGSALYLLVEQPIQIQIDEQYRVMEAACWSLLQAQGLLSELLNQQQHDDFLNFNEQRFSIDLPHMGRFRCHVFWQRQAPAIIVKQLVTDLPSLEQLELPVAIEPLISETTGLVLFAGTALSGISTTLHAALNYRRAQFNSLIMTLEEPIEVEYPISPGVVIQREVGTDVESFAVGVNAAMCQSPDVLVLTDIPDYQTLKGIISLIHAGHLVVASLHAMNVVSALQRILAMCPQAEQQHMLFELSQILRGVFCLQRVAGLDRDKKYPIVDLLLSTATVRQAIRDNQITQLSSYIEQGNTSGMKSFDQCLVELYQQGMISREIAIANAQLPSDMMLKLKLLDQHASPHVIQQTSDFEYE